MKAVYPSIEIYFLYHSKFNSILGLIVVFKMKDIIIKIRPGERLIVETKLPNRKKFGKYAGKWAGGNVEILDDFAAVRIFKKKN